MEIKNISTLVLRVLLGIVFFVPGWQDITNPKFSADAFLTKVAYGPLQNVYHGMAGNPAISALVAWGLLLIGLCLMLGAFVKLASVLGIIQMALFYFARFPPQHNLIDEHIIYAAAMLVLFAMNAGRFAGLDKYLANTTFAEENSWFKNLLG